MFDTTKPWWQSKSVWASLVAVLAVIAGYFKYDIAAADQAALVEAITTIVAAVGGLLAALFRVTATTQIGPSPKGPLAILISLVIVVCLVACTSTPADKAAACEEARQAVAAADLGLTLACKTQSKACDTAGLVLKAAHTSMALLCPVVVLPST